MHAQGETVNRTILSRRSASKKLLVIPAVISGNAFGQQETQGVPIRLDHNVLSMTKRSVVQVFASNSTGSGFIVAAGKSTHCLTNLHVVRSSMQLASRDDPARRQASPIVVRSAFGIERQASVWKVHVGFDLALLRLESALPDELAANVDESLPRAGQPVFIWGAPYGQALVPIDGTVASVYSGSVSLDSVQTPANLIRMRLSAQPGNSGGPVLTLDGRVIGMVTQRDETSGVSNGFSTAVSTSAFWTAIHGFILAAG